MKDKSCQMEYIRRIHKVQDYIEDHMGGPLSVEELSTEAGFSKYHFSRIFQGILHEPLVHYVNRIRMERASFYLAHREDKNMTEIAYELGFTDSAMFSRAFKTYYGISPREYRKEYSKNCKDSFVLSEYNKITANKEKAKIGIPVNGTVTIDRIAKSQIVYVRHSGTYESLAKEYARLIDSLFVHAKKQNLLRLGENRVLAIYHDNPEFGEQSQFRTSLCLTVPEDLVVNEDEVLGKMTLEGGLYAIGQFRIRQDQYSDAWDYMYQEWLTCSGYVPRNSYPFELYQNNPKTDPDHMHEISIYVPIEPIRF